jgi:hypothetical protein
MNRARETVRRELSGEGFVMDVALIIRGQDARFGPTNSTTFGFNTVWLDGSHSRAVVCHASCPLLGRHPRNILIAVRDALWMDGSGWTEQSNAVNGPGNVPLDSSFDDGSRRVRQFRERLLPHRRQPGDRPRGQQPVGGGPGPGFRAAERINAQDPGRPTPAHTNKSRPTVRRRRSANPTAPDQHTYVGKARARRRVSVSGVACPGYQLQRFPSWCLSAHGRGRCA